MWCKVPFLLSIYVHLQDPKINVPFESREGEVTAGLVTAIKRSTVSSHDDTWLAIEDSEYMSHHFKWAKRLVDVEQVECAVFVGI